MNVFIVHNTFISQTFIYDELFVKCSKEAGGKQK